MTAVVITTTSDVPTVGADEDTWGTENNAKWATAKADLDALALSPATTIKGNSTGAPQGVDDLTPATVATMLPALVGDSGSGGTKGLVPAPASGDAAAEKYLNADGTWGVPQPFAWARINGTTGALIAGFNATATREALGHYRLTFTTAAATANFGYGGTAYHGSNFYICSGYGATTTYCDVRTMLATIAPALSIADAAEVTIWAFQ